MWWRVAIALCITALLAVLPARPQGLNLGIWKTTASAANPPAVDNTCDASASSCSLTVVTGELCVVGLTGNAYQVGNTTVVNDGTNNWTFRKDSQSLGNPGAAGNLIELFYRVATVSATQTITVSGQPFTFIEIFGACFSGVNASPFDGNGSVPAAATTGTVSVSTNKGNTLIYEVIRYAGGGTCGTGWTATVSGSFSALCTHTFTNTQSGLTCPDVTVTPNSGIICDAIDGL